MITNKFGVIKNLNKVKIDYIYHSGFLLETEAYILIFDYFKECTDNNFIYNKILKTDKNVLVFASHSHFDHFNAEIFKWKDINPKIKYILSSDIEAKDSFPEYISIAEGENISIGDITIKSYGSTDIGISFLVNIDRISIFHAGDLNWWHWKEDSDKENSAMEKAFKKQIGKLVDENIDIAFFSVDGRLEEYYYLGGEYFIQNIKPKIFIPMHFGDNFKITKDFKCKMNSRSTDIVEINRVGQEIL
jgi:L-ascorbate metabolism protein UlaG (beta-lactamase superfamily)